MDRRQAKRAVKLVLPGFRPLEALEAPHYILFYIMLYYITLCYMIIYSIYYIIYNIYLENI